MVVIRVFDGRGNIKEISIKFPDKSISVFTIKQCLQSKFNILASNLLVTSTFHDTLFEDGDIVNAKHSFLIAFLKDNKQPLCFRAASARARSAKYEKYICDLTTPHHEK